MKLSVLILLFLAVANSSSHQLTREEAERQFAEYKAKFGKSYQPVEDAKRFVTFWKKLESILSHNKRYEKREVSYTEGLNSRSDWFPEEKKRQEIDPKSVLSNLGMELNFEDLGTRRAARAASSVPENWDWREQGVVAPVKDQGDCKASWAFSAVAAFETEYAIDSGRLVEFSEQMLIDCNKKNLGCEDGSPEDGLQVLLPGVATQQQYPYVGKKQECQYNNKTMNTTGGTGYYTIHCKKEDTLVEAIYNHGAIAVLLNLEPLEDYKGGVFDGVCWPEPNQAATLVGYGLDEESQKPYFLVRNSWGPDWGENGYARILRNFNMCGIDELKVFPVINKS